MKKMKRLNEQEIRDMFYEMGLDEINKRHFAINQQEETSEKDTDTEFIISSHTNVDLLKNGEQNYA